MKHKIITLAILAATINLTACISSYNSDGQTQYQNYSWWGGEPINPNGYYNYNGKYASQGSSSTQQEPREVVVPESYHVGSYHSPTRASDRDRNWVDRQNPGGYTIQLSEGEKASRVAGKLYKAPKTNRRAQVKSYRNGKPYYKGVYGTYSNYESAQEALNALPEDVRQGANIKSWGSVQEQ